MKNAQAGEFAQPPEKLKRELMTTLRGHFRPEFLNRLDEVIVFESLSKAQIEDIVRLQLEQVKRAARPGHLPAHRRQPGRPPRRRGLPAGVRRPRAEAADPPATGDAPGHGDAQGRGERGRDGHLLLRRQGRRRLPARAPRRSRRHARNPAPAETPKGRATAARKPAAKKAPPPRARPTSRRPSDPTKVGEQGTGRSVEISPRLRMRPGRSISHEELPMRVTTHATLAAASAAQRPPPRSPSISGMPPRRSPGHPRATLPR